MDEEERYEIQGKIGEGGLGSIYKAYDRQLNRTVAIKRIHPDPSADPEEAFQSILKESRALSALSSTHIVSVFDIDQDEDGPYVVMEFLEGETLESLVNRAPLVEADFIATAEQTLEGLIAAHERKIIHRDIKPSNLMFTWLPSGRFQLKILDFGLAKFSAEPSVQTMAHGNSLLGSIFFMAPEQFSRQPLDGRTDLYALGCVLYYSITATHPFEGANAAEVMAGHIQGIYPPLDDIRPDLNPSLLRWLDQLLAREPDDRFPDAQSALDALETIKRAPRPDTITGPVAVNRPVLETGPLPTAAGALAAETPGEGHPAPNPLTVKLPTTGFPVWLLISVGVLAAGILILSVIALTSGRLDPDEPPPAAGSFPESTPPETESTENPPEPETNDSYRLFLLEHDKNGDRRLNLDEFSHPGPKETQTAFHERLRALDTNNNSILEFGELHNADTAERFRSFLEKHDRDQSNKLSEEEFTSLLAPRGRAAAGTRFLELDLDQDDLVTAEELEFGRLRHWIWKKLPE